MHKIVYVMKVFDVCHELSTTSLMDSQVEYLVQACHVVCEHAHVKYAATYLYINDVYVVRPKLP